LSIFRSANFQGQSFIEGRFVVNSPKGEGRNQNLFFLGNMAALGEQFAAATKPISKAMRGTSSTAC